MCELGFVVRTRPPRTDFVHASGRPPQPISYVNFTVHRIQDDRPELICEKTKVTYQNTIFKRVHLLWIEWISPAHLPCKGQMSLHGILCPVLLAVRLSLLSKNISTYTFLSFSKFRKWISVRAYSTISAFLADQSIRSILQYFNHCEYAYEVLSRLWSFHNIRVCIRFIGHVRIYHWKYSRDVKETTLDSKFDKRLDPVGPNEIVIANKDAMNYKLISNIY